MINSLVSIDAGTLPEDFEYPDYGSAGATMIAPNATMEGTSLRIPIGTLIKMREGTAHAYVWGWCDYNSTIPDSPRHRAEFCFKIEVEANPIQGGFAYRQHGPFNGFDDDCLRTPKPYEPMPGRR
jgi:hypothetical protein